jgi:PAS domain-containing protein
MARSGTFAASGFPSLKPKPQKVCWRTLDVTEHELVTQELRRREAYLAEAQRLSHTGSFGWRPDDGEVVWSDETYRIFEYDRDEKPTLDMVFQRIHPDDRAHAQRVTDGISSSTDIEHQYRLVMPGGAIKHVHVKAHALPDMRHHRSCRGGDRHYGAQDSRGQDPTPARCRYSRDLLREP